MDFTTGSWSSGPLGDIARFISLLTYLLTYSWLCVGRGEGMVTLLPGMDYRQVDPLDSGAAYSQPHQRSNVNTIGHDDGEEEEELLQQLTTAAASH